MLPKPKASEPRSQFLFVNENATTVSKGSKDPELDREKQSHVQRHNFAQRAAKRNQIREHALPLRSTSSPQRSLLQTAGENDLDFDWASFDAFINSDAQPADEPDDEVFPATQNHSYQLGVHSQPLVAQRRGRPSHAEHSLPQYPLQSTTTHPLFSGSAEILEKWAPALFEHWNTIIIPEKFFADARFRPLAEIRHAGAVHEESTKAMSAPEHLYSFLALASARMLKREGRLNLPDVKEEDYHRVPLYFQGKAMEAVRKALERGVSHEIVVDVHRLTAIATFNNAHAASNPHFDAMMAMVESLGGLETFGNYFEETVILNEWATGLRLLAPVRLPVTWDPGYGTPEIAAKLEELDSKHDSLGHSMTAILSEIPVQEELAQGFRDIVQLTRFHRWLRGQEEYNREYYRYLLLRQSAIGSRLLNLGSASTTRNEALRIALIYEIGLTRSPGAQRCASENLAKLQLALESSGMEDWQELDHLLLWIATVGGLTARKKEEIDWFASLAATTAKRLDEEVYSDLAKMEDLLSGFLYEPQFQREALLDFRQRMRKASSTT